MPQCRTTRVLERLKRMHQTEGTHQDPGAHKAPITHKITDDKPQRKTAPPQEHMKGHLMTAGGELPEQRVQHFHVMCRPPTLGSSPRSGAGAATLMGAVTKKIGGSDRQQQQQKLESLGHSGSSTPSAKWLVPSPAAASDPKALLQQPSTEPRPQRQCQGTRGPGGGPLECRRLQEELQSCRGQLSALQEEVAARKELDATREVAMERLTRHAEEQEQQVAEAQAMNLQLHEELEQLAPWVEKAQLVAQHASGLAAAVRAIMAECNYSSVAGIRDLRADELMLLDQDTLDSELGVLAGGLEHCLAALQRDQEKQREAGDDAARLRERIGALTAAKEAAEARERQLQDAALALEEQLGHLRGISAEHETALRRETEESVLESKVGQAAEARARPAVLAWVQRHPVCSSRADCVATRCMRTVCVSACMSVRLCGRVCQYLSVCLCLCVPVCSSRSDCVTTCCMRVHCACVRVCVCVCASVCVSVCVCVFRDP